MNTIQVQSVRDADGLTFSAQCTCGQPLVWFVQRGTPMPVSPGPFPSDVECPKCHRWWNSFGQPISPMNFDPSYAGEEW